MTLPIIYKFNLEVNNNLRITSFNCKNVKTSVDSIVNLCASSDIILLQETWLCEDELHMLNSIHNNFYACGVSSMKSDEKILCGRPQNLFTTVKSCKHKKFVLDNLNNVSVDCVLSSSTEVSQAIASLDNGKACGLDNIFSENLKYGGSRISVLLSLCFNAFLGQHFFIFSFSRIFNYF